MNQLVKARKKRHSTHGRSKTALDNFNFEITQICTNHSPKPCQIALGSQLRCMWKAVAHPKPEECPALDEGIGYWTIQSRVRGVQRLTSLKPDMPLGYLTPETSHTQHCVTYII